MFSRNCPRCGKKISQKYEFCPYCGFNLKRAKEEKDYGLLGRDDTLPDFGLKMPFGFERLFSSLMKQIDKEFKKIDKEIGKDTEKMPKIKPKGFSISISSASGKKPEIRIRGMGPKMKLIPPQKQIKKISQPKISDAQAKKLAKLPREEAETRVRRMSDKIIYEIKLPGVKTLKNVIINRLENSVEIKAFSKDKIYVKLIPMAMPILDYKLSKEKLTIEFKAK